MRSLPGPVGWERRWLTRSPDSCRFEHPDGGNRSQPSHRLAPLVGVQVAEEEAAEEGARARLVRATPSVVE